MRNKIFFNGTLLKRKISRRDFIKLIATLIALLPFSEGLLKPSFAKAVSFNGRTKKTIKAKHDLVVVEGKDPYAMTAKTIEALGGMEQFVKKNSVVVIKPNIGWDRIPEQAANTNPQVVAALVELCFKAGAKRVNVLDRTCNDDRRCYLNSGIQKAASEKGASVYFVNTWDVIKAQFPYDSPLNDWPILRDAIECDTFINVPVLKHHGLTRLTLSMKNLMGVCGGSRGIIHQGIGRKLVDLTAFINPELTVIDAFRVLTDNGPTGGSLDNVVYKNKVLASTDPTLADLYACSIVDVDPQEVSYLKHAIQSNFGITDTAKADIMEIELSR